MAKIVSEEQTLMVTKQGEPIVTKPFRESVLLVISGHRILLTKKEARQLARALLEYSEDC